MFDFLNLKTEAFGIDISDLSLKVIKLKKKRNGLALASFGEAEMKSGIVRNGEVKKEDELVKMIKKVTSEVNGEKIGIKYVVASLSEEKSFSQVIQMPYMAEQDLKTAVIFESENHIPLPIEQVYLDSQIIPPIVRHSNHHDVLIAATPKKIVDPYVSCLKKSGLKPVALEIESSAVARALIKGGISAQPILLIDLGETRTSFIVFSGNSIRSTFSIQISSRGLAEIISRVLEIDFAQAEKLKLKYGVAGGKTEEGEKVFEAMIPTLTDLVEQIKKYLDYYQTHVSNDHSPSTSNEIKKCLLCGGGANLKGLKEFLSAELKFSVEMGNPFVNISEKINSKMPSERYLSYSTAIGLALRGINQS